jgi:hypothetical protein
MRATAASWLRGKAVPDHELPAPPGQPDCFRGYGPKGYDPDDEQLRATICDRLRDDPYIDATGITVEVRARVVTLEGYVRTDYERLRSKRIAAAPGVTGVLSNLQLWEGTENISDARFSSTPTRR